MTKRQWKARRRHRKWAKTLLRRVPGGDKRGRTWLLTRAEHSVDPVLAQIIGGAVGSAAP